MLDFLADHLAIDYSITELAECTGMSRPTIYGALAELTGQGFITQSRTLGRSRLFKINAANILVGAIIAQDIVTARATAGEEVSKTRALHPAPKVSIKKRTR